MEKVWDIKITKYEQWLQKSAEWEEKSVYVTEK
jgi:hypothetical protein